MDTHLGRHVEHDPRSLQYPAAQATHLHDVSWQYHGAVLDQGQVGSCTGNSAVEVLMCSPYYDHKAENFTEKDALGVYKLATHLDRVPGIYPPTDTGSSGLAVMKACRELGYITGYTHAFGIDHALAALMLGPVITGVPWLKAMFTPDADGTVHAKGPVEGGHEFTVLGYSGARSAVRCLNHWTDTWGDKGYFWLSVNDWSTLLKQQGDVAVPII
jgi:hypothetical protein